MASSALDILATAAVAERTRLMQQRNATCLFQGHVSDSAARFLRAAGAKDVWQAIGAWFVLLERSAMPYSFGGEFASLSLRAIILRAAMGLPARAHGAPLDVAFDSTPDVPLVFGEWPNAPPLLSILQAVTPIVGTRSPLAEVVHVLVHVYSALQ
jgi:hypothetical protein